MSPLRLIAALALALAAVSGLGYLASRTVLARPEFAPGGRPQYVAAPVPLERVPSVPAGRRLGPTAVDPGWLSATAAATGIPRPALRAYARVQLDGAGGCAVGWTTLAGIGWVESQHGTIGGRRLHADGHSSTRILGPALDGHGRFSAIHSTAGSATWHGDAVWEHAVGPMQFLPATWETWASDGDSDGAADPNDLDDAAAATARYLCAAGGGDLSTGAGWTAAVLAYNHERAYVDAVHSAATSYAERSR